jgi:hypothetical protein
LALAGVCEHPFVRPVVSPHTRLRRALDRRNLRLVREAAGECPHLDLEDSLRILLLIASQEPELYERAAVRWVGRLLAARPGMGLDLARQALDGMANMAGVATDAGRSQLAVVLRAVGEPRAAEALLSAAAP